MSRREILTAHYKSLASRIMSRASVVAIILLFMGIAPVANAAQITSRSLTLGSSSPGASTTYAFAFSDPTTATIQSVDFSVCTTPLGGCTTPTGFSVTGDSLTSQPTGLGAAAGWTNSAATAGHLRLSDASNATAASGAATVSFSAVTNSTTANTAFYVRITTYTGSNWSTGPTDTGNVAASTEDTSDMSVNAQVAESLLFCVGTTATATGSNPCGTVSGNSVTLSANPLSTAGISTGTSQFGASTNAGSGLVVTYSAGQFTNGVHNFTNTFGTGGAASSPGTEEFGLNVAATGTGAASVAPYNGTNYAFQPSGAATTIANSGSAAIATGNWTVTYGANVAATTPFGSYADTFVYVCTPTF